MGDFIIKQLSLLLLCTNTSATGPNPVVTLNAESNKVVNNYL